MDIANDPFVSGAGFGFGFGFAGAPRMSASKYHPAPSRNEVAVVQPVLVGLSTFTFPFAWLISLARTGQVRGRRYTVLPPYHAYRYFYGVEAGNYQGVDKACSAVAEGKGRVEAEGKREGEGGDCTW